MWNCGSVKGMHGGGPFAYKERAKVWEVSHTFLQLNNLHPSTEDQQETNDDG